MNIFSVVAYTRAKHCTHNYSRSLKWWTIFWHVLTMIRLTCLTQHTTLEQNFMHVYMIFSGYNGLRKSTKQRFKNHKIFIFTSQNVRNTSRLHPRPWHLENHMLHTWPIHTLLTSLVKSIKPLVCGGLKLYLVDYLMSRTKQKYVHTRHQWPQY